MERKLVILAIDQCSHSKDELELGVVRIDIVGKAQINHKCRNVLVLDFDKPGAKKILCMTFDSSLTNEQIEEQSCFIVVEEKDEHPCYHATRVIVHSSCPI